MGNTPIENFLGPHLADAATNHDHLTSEICAEELKKVIAEITRRSILGSDCRTLNVMILLMILMSR